VTGSVEAWGHPAREPLGDDLHVWWLHLDDHAPQRYVSALGEAERTRADRLRTASGYRSFVLTRAVLRRLLAGYVGRSDVVFRYGPHGKPALAGGAQVAFNVSHTRSRAVLAFRACGRVGVDIEEVRANVAGDRLADRFFVPAEAAALRALPPADQLAGFFRCWARKEAVVKAVGDGLSHDLRSFTVSVDPQAPAALRTATGEAWQLYDLDAGPDHAAALAVSGPAPPMALRQFTWPGPAAG
jgi:4'-phosphopantetheinyl transferase